MLSINSKRESGVELLKVLAIFGIIICHCYTSFSVATNYDNVCFFEISNFSVLERFIMQIIITLGYIGNTIFFVCSSWFLVDKQSNKKDKIISIILNNLIISIIISICYIISGSNLTNEQLIKTLFPLTNENNWYITCYAIFYLIYPYINLILNKIEKKEHLTISLIIFTMYFVVAFFFLPDSFYVNKLISFIAIYVIVSYIKKYKKGFCDNIKQNIILFIISSLCFYGIIFLNFAIVPINITWHTINNPFFLIMSISLLNIFRKFNFHSNIINTVSGLSLFIYIIHDNFIFRDSGREQLASYFMINYGTDNIILKIMLFALLLFILVSFISYCYKKIIGERIDKVSKRIETIFQNCNRRED